MVTHDPVAAAMSDRLVLLRDGQVVADGARRPEPASDRGAAAGRVRGRRAGWRRVPA